ncbi:hypothetical protein SARC_09698 [Sphaeroforma arctica JP610]|uniref:Uncharacterized protein n=1 Tax=Sphaeroforma arctica JP610 TaxID=667725 RepID=A0A0L0FMW6_9EUKA|nr:hypothetical protein SARC_09698 [Sphaeroforma arctica JP610]KNC77856.1 hypothetical protein SARC_09698 [Sphaeroforma arctica JP610]|eukprot:XP_014151758.1 hypothetical protein SARC_09698 [Sphaeroforma arctica JP610]
MSTLKYHLVPGSGVLHTITSNKKGICAAGIDRVAFFIDPRRWRASGSWRGGLKFDINKVYLSGSLDNTAFAFGRIDGEFATGSWEAKGNKTSSSRLTKKNFLADSRYVGVGRIPGEDAFISIVSSKHLYTLDHCDAYATRALPKSTHSPPPVDGPLDHVGKKKKLNDEKSD